MPDEATTTTTGLPQELLDAIGVTVTKTVENLVPEITKALEKQNDAIKAQQIQNDLTLQNALKATMNPLAELATGLNTVPATAWRRPTGWKGTEKDLHIAAKFLLMTEAAAEIRYSPQSNAAVKFTKYSEELVGMGLKTATAGNAGTMGFLVPVGFDNTVADYAEQYASFSLLGMQINMAGLKQISLPRIDTGATGYWLAEGAAVTASNMTGSQINLDVRGLGHLTKYSRLLDETSAVALVPLIARKFAESAAYKKESAFLIGDGTSAYGNIVGLATKLGLAFTSTSTDSVGVRIGAGNAYSELTLADFIATKNKLRSRYRTNAKWIMNRDAWAAAEILIQSAGGATGQEIINGVGNQKFLGFPVITSDTLPAEGNSVLGILFGDFSASAYYGTQGGLQIETATQNDVDWTQNLIATKGIEMLDYVVHGEQSIAADGSTVQSGAYVGLRLKAS